jgi:hypothetical protein
MEYSVYLFCFDECHGKVTQLSGWRSAMYLNTRGSIFKFTQLFRMKVHGWKIERLGLSCVEAHDNEN